MIYMGIDQGIANLGYCIIEENDETKKTTLLFYGLITTKPKIPQPKRIVEIVDKLMEIVKTYQPEELVCEKLFCNPPKPKGTEKGRNKSASIVSTNIVSGLISYIAGKNDKDFVDISPMTVKKLITGFGKSQKEVVRENVLELYPELKDVKLTEHTIDSIAIATARIKQKIELEEEPVVKEVESSSQKEIKKTKTSKKSTLKEPKPKEKP